MTQVSDITLFKTIFDQSPISTQVFTPDGRTWMVNKAWEKLWGITFAQLGSYNILEDTQLIAAGIMPYIKQGFKGEVVTQPPIKYEPAKTLNIKGTVAFRWVAAQLYPIKDDKGALQFVVLQHEDVSERKRAEEITARLAAIVESSDDAIVSKGLDGIITSWNKSAEHLFGYTEDEAIGQHITLIIPKELIKEESEIISRLKEGKRIHHFQTIRLAKSGERVHVSLSISPVRDESGTIIGASKIARNVTKEIQAAQTLKESEERLSIALEAGKIGVWDWNVTENTLTWTDSVYDIHAVTKKTFTPTFENFKALIHPVDKARVTAELQKSLKAKKEFIAEFRIVTPAGEVRWVYTRAIATYDKSNKPTRVLGATSNITEQKQLDQEKSDFLSMASHELKTPLTSMKMFVELLHKELVKHQLDRPLYFTQRIKDQTERLAELTNDLLDVSRIETGKLKLNMKEFDLVALIKDTVEDLQTSAPQKLMIKGDKKLLLNADSYRVYQVVVNLLTNSIKYSPKTKNIIVTVIKKDNQAVVSVKDHGIGIAKSKQKKIFERLYQVADPEEKTFPGLGLGLYISKEIIERHRGKIWVSSDKGKGTTFYFSIPVRTVLI